MIAQQTVEQLPIKKVKPAPDNPRSKVGDVTELAMSIREVGVRQPVLVVPRNGGYELVAGARRLAAAELAGLETVPAIVDEQMSDGQRLLVMTIENLQREDLTPLEEANAYQRLLDELKITQRDLAPKVGKTQSHISKRVALLGLPKDVQKEVDSGGITIADAVELAKISEHPKRVKDVLRGPTFQTVATRVQHQLDELKVEKKITDLEERFESQGIETVRVRSEYQLPKGVHRLKGGNAYDAQALQITAAKHEKLSCHAIAISDRALAFPVCTDRKQHKDVKTKQEADRANGSRSTAARAPREDPQTKQLNEARDRRLAFAGKLVAKKPPKEAINLILRAMLIDAFDQSFLEDADVARMAIWLGLVPAPTDGSTLLPDDVHAEGLILEFLDRGEAELQRVAFAFTAVDLDSGHSDVTRWIRYGDAYGEARVRGYLEFLRAQGDELSQYELIALDKAAARAGERKAAA